MDSYQQRVDELAGEIDRTTAELPARKLNWTQPVCSPCFLFANAYHGEMRVPVRALGREARTCCNCGAKTTEGIFIRIDPRLVRQPA